MLEHYKPFNLEHAKAGAPVSTVDGRAVEFLRWDMKGGECLILGVVDNGPLGDLACRWTNEGEPHAEREKECKLVMVPLGMLEGKPVFVGDEMISTLTGESVVVPPNWWDIQYLKWPQPAPQYPQTRMTAAELESEWNEAIMDAAYLQEGETARKAIANASIARAIEDGDVFVPAVGNAYGYRATFRSEEIFNNNTGFITVGKDEFVPAAMLEKVAQAILKHIQTHAADFMNAKLTDAKPWIDVAAIITSVREGKT